MAVVLFCLGAVLIVGCGGSQSAPAMKVALAPGTPQVPAAAGPVGAGNAAQPAPDIPVDRKIIFTGTLVVEVRDFDAARASVTSLVQIRGGFFAKTDVTGDAGQKRSGTFTIKVPAEHFQPLVEALAALGNPVKNQTDSQDVTEEYVDVAARVRNLKAEEEVLNKLLKDVAGRLDDVFRIREQIRNNRGEIEKAEGRMQTLAKLTALSTITLTLRETEAYHAPTAPKPDSPSFERRAEGTWAASVGALRTLGEWVGLAGVATAPWMPLALAAGGMWWLWRRRANLARAFEVAREQSVGTG
jgi:hypothetical protein